MAQYGRNYYGASYYGVSSVFAGQFTSDETNLTTPLNNVAPSDGKLYADILCAHPRITYAYPDPIFTREGTWSEDSTSDPSFKLVASLTASTLLLNYSSAVDSAIIDIEVKTYAYGTLFDTQNFTVDTMDPGPYTIEPSQFGEQVITITKNTSSSVGDVFQFESLVAMTTDLKFEMRRKAAGTWGPWSNIPLTATQSNFTYNGFSNVYRYTASTPNWVGATVYQFKLMMASSDNTNTPEVISADIHTASTSDYSDAGFWKTTIDLGAGVTSIDSVTYVSSIPEGTDLQVRSRTSNVDGSWSFWSLPYSADTTRAILNYKADNSIKAGYIMTPLASPENLTTWQGYKLAHFVNDVDTLTGSLTPGSNIEVEVVTANYNPLTPDPNEVLASFTHLNSVRNLTNISSLGVPVRFKINFNRTAAISSPCIDSMDAISNAYYKEYRTFGTGTTDLKGYGSAVYGDNSGIDKVYTDGLGRSDEASIENFDFTIPTGAENPDYVIEIGTGFGETYTAEEVDISWNSNNQKTVRLEGALTDDYLVVKVKEAKEPRRVRKHYRYGSGVATVIDPGYISSSITNTFSPSLDSETSYAFYLKNGFIVEDPNENLSIRWSSENALDESSRRGITYTLNDQVYIGIVSSTEKGLVEWVSEEKKFEGIVNANDRLGNYSAVLRYSSDPAASQIPEIDREVIINSDPSIIPYKIEVIEGSVTSHGERKPDDRLSGEVRYLYSTDLTPSLQESVEVMVPVVRSAGNADRLPKAMVKKLNGTSGGVTLGVYSSPGLFSPDFANKIDQNDGSELPAGQYKYYASGGTYNNVIDWSPGIATSNVPDTGSTYYVSYVYDKVVSLKVEFSCDYSEYEPSLQIFRSIPVSVSADCSPMVDYVSPEIPFDWFNIPEDVDDSTLRLVVYDDNPRVRTYIEGNRVIGTLDKRDPRESWNPYVKGGYYYINKDSYYMFTNESKYELGSSIIPQAKNIIYTDGVNGTSVLLQEETENLFSNPKLEKGSSIENAFEEMFSSAGPI